MREGRLKEKANEQAKVISSLGKFGIRINGRPQIIHSLKSELTETQKKPERGLDNSKQEVGGWRDEAREQKVEAGQLKRRVRRFEWFFYMHRTC